MMDLGRRAWGAGFGWVQTPPATPHNSHATILSIRGQGFRVHRELKDHGNVAAARAENERFGSGFIYFKFCCFGMLGAEPGSSHESLCIARRHAHACPQASGHALRRCSSSAFAFPGRWYANEDDAALRIRRPWSLKTIEMPF